MSELGPRRRNEARRLHCPLPCSGLSTCCARCTFTCTCCVLLAACTQPVTCNGIRAVRTRRVSAPLTAGSCPTGADEFSRWLTFARLHAAADLSDEISFEHYQYAKQLDMSRAMRLKTKEAVV